MTVVGVGVGVGFNTVPSINYGVPAVYLPSSTMFIHWSVPVRAYPGINLDFKLTGYDWFNRTLVWSLDTFPTGMSIDSATGVITWSPTSPAQDGDHTVTARLTVAAGVYLTKTWTINVNTNEFIFVSTTGNDTTGDGSIGAPYATLAKADGDIVSGVGKDIICRGGTYNIDLGISTFLNTKSFSASDSVRIFSYPTEAAIFDCINTYYGITCFSDYVIWDKIQITQCTGNETAGLMLWTNAVAKRCNVNNCDWSDQFNCTGFYMTAGSLMDSCLAYDNQNTGTIVTEHNSSNYLYYGDKGSGEAFVIDCVSGQSAVDSKCGFKIKHADSNPIHYHKSVARYSKWSYPVAQNYASIRCCIGFSLHEVFTPNKTDISSGNDSGMLVQDSSLLLDGNASENAAVYHDGRYVFFTDTVNTGLLLKGNTLLNVLSGTASGGCLIHYGNYTALGSPFFLENHDFKIIANKLYAPADSNIMERGSGNLLNTAAINALDGNSDNTYEGVAPASLVMSAGGGVNLTQTTWTWNKVAQTLVQS